MGLQPTRIGMNIQSLPLTRGRLGGGRLSLLFSEQITEGGAGREDFFDGLPGVAL